MKRSWLEHNGGPVDKIPASKPKRGFKQTNPTPDLKAKVIVSAGQPLMPQRLSKIINEILTSRALLDAEIKPKPYAQSRVTRDAPRASRPGGVPPYAQSTARDEGRINVKSSGSRIPDA